MVPKFWSSVPDLMKDNGSNCAKLIIPKVFESSINHDEIVGKTQYDTLKIIHKSYEKLYVHENKKLFLFEFERESIDLYYTKLFVVQTEYLAWKKFLVPAIQHFIL